MNSSIGVGMRGALVWLALSGLAGCGDAAGTIVGPPLNTSGGENSQPGQGGAVSTGSGGQTTTGSGGTLGAGGSGNGGALGSGGGMSLGGSTSGGKASGGNASGGNQNNGGIGNGGRVGSGGASAGGAKNGGTGNGGANNAGSGNAGASSGGRASGGAASGGRAAGGVASGGAANGGVANGGSGGDPFSVGSTCTSGVTWKSGNGATMRPGEPCVGCHNFTIAGTVYPTGHEPNDCNGVGTSAAASVIITDAKGTTLTLAVNAAGNFYSSKAITVPYTAKVQTSKGSRVMAAMQTNGNCNSCHTQNGTTGAPGRIVVP